MNTMQLHLFPRGNAALQQHWNVEYALCGLLMICKCLLLYKNWNVAVGFDWQAHVDMLPVVRWTSWTPDLFSIFYNYHPPLAFLLARSIFLLGIPAVASIQVISMLAMLVSFLFLRASLRLLRLLERPEGIMLLYGTFGIPLNVYLSYSVNMDAVLFAWVSGVLYYSIRVFLLQEQRDIFQQVRTCITISLFLAAGMLTKFTGVLFITLPLFVWYFLATHRPWKILWIPMCSVLLALTLVFPYYYARYYRDTGAWFPSNTNIYDAGAQQYTRMQRDQDPLGFLSSIFQTTPMHANGLQFRDLEHPRISDTYKDFWIMDQWLVDRWQGGSTTRARPIGIVYFYGMIPLLMGGAYLFARGNRGQDIWRRWGRFTLAFSGLLVASLVMYIYINPYANALANKGIYIAPVTWSIGLLLAEYFHRFRFSPTARSTAMCLMALFLLLNHLVPVY